MPYDLRTYLSFGFSFGSYSGNMQAEIHWPPQTVA